MRPAPSARGANLKRAGRRPQTDPKSREESPIAIFRLFNGLAAITPIPATWHPDPVDMAGRTKIEHAAGFRKKMFVESPLGEPGLSDTGPKPRPENAGMRAALTPTRSLFAGEGARVERAAG